MFRPIGTHLVPPRSSLRCIFERPLSFSLILVVGWYIMSSSMNAIAGTLGCRCSATLHVFLATFMYPALESYVHKIRSQFGSFACHIAGFGSFACHVAGWLRRGHVSWRAPWPQLVWRCWPLANIYRGALATAPVCVGRDGGTQPSPWGACTSLRCGRAGMTLRTTA